MKKTLLVLTMAAAATSASCEAPDNTDLYNRMSTVTAGSPELLSSLTPRQGGTVQTVPGLEAEVIAVIDSAKVSLKGAFEHLESPAVAQAFINAQQRGVDVKIVGDIDHADQEGFQLLVDNLQKNADGLDPITFGDGTIFYSPQPTVEVNRPGELNRMTHNFVIADERRVYNITGGFEVSTIPLFQIGFDATSEDIGKDFADEFTQMHGGMFSTTLSTFNGPLKTDSNTRTHYPHDGGDLEIFFGPQERILKRVLDEIYRARASVFIVTEELNNIFIGDALRYKAMNGFDVGVVVSEENRDAPSSEVDQLRADFDGIRGGEALPDLRLAPGMRLNVIIIDANPSPIDGKQYKTRVLVLSQPLLEAISFFQDDAGRTTARAADSFSDSNMWALTRLPNGTAEPNVDRFIEMFQFIFNQGN